MRNVDRLISGRLQLRKFGFEIDRANGMRVSSGPGNAGDLQPLGYGSLAALQPARNVDNAVTLFD